MDAMITNYFLKLLATEHPCGIEEALEGIEELVSEEMNATLDLESTGEETREALFQMHPITHLDLTECISIFLEVLGYSWE